ncbi:MAG: glutamate--tRNA ligase [Candidatus Parvarchaeota archaeon]|nr:glutamate--tRNA ligase [Candidatus Jingweiarchaeum tengchongense]MCW1298480.1 glutamate--tRNA ligase [Candidatus Jingweiarchaeum tengchongense]MCW1305780.1 glutamate--tRNA ligase [Candidatus Jingweiarchaeum tengchongense]MCW1310164.1 glutamate--tRNA ligase [Candidatus Jingweiarchaeum tengchongense]
MKDLILKHALKNAIEHGGKAIVGAVISKVIAEKPELKTRIKELSKEISEIVKEVNELSVEEQKKKLEKVAPELLEKKKIEEKKGLKPLPNAEKGKVVTRLPPEPSGFMHIGHGMSGLLNYLYAKMYDGKVWLRFEDTNPRKVRKEYYDSFRRGYRWLGIEWDYEKRNSDDIEIYYKYASKLVLSGAMYACECKKDKIRKNRSVGIECEHRSNSIEENFEKWEKMLAGFYKEGEIIFRLKGDMNSKNYVMRDPTLFRIVDFPHPFTREKYKVWPTYDFSVAIEDSICGITHVLRSSEFAQRGELQNRIRELLNLKGPLIIEYSRFNFKGSPVSKRKIRPLIESGIIKTWDDPRLTTIDGIRRRGIIPEAIREFTITQTGITQSERAYEWELLFAVNRKMLDPITKRYFVVLDPIKVLVKNAPSMVVKLKYHPEKELGFREIKVNGIFYLQRDDVRLFKENDIIRLKDLFNIKIEKISEKEVIASFYGKEMIEKVPKVQWVTDENVKLVVYYPDVLFINDEVNKRSLEMKRGIGEIACSSLKEGDIIQAERIGFMRLDKKENDELSFIFSHR